MGVKALTTSKMPNSYVRAFLLRDLCTWLSTRPQVRRVLVLPATAHAHTGCRAARGVLIALHRAKPALPACATIRDGQHCIAAAGLGGVHT